MTRTFLGPRPSEEQVKRLLLVDLDDYLTEYLDPDFKLDDEFHDKMYDAIRELRHLWCEVKGHQMENDTCGKPEHRYCIMCDKGAAELDLV